MIRTVFVVLCLGLATLFVMPFLILWSWLTGDPKFMYFLSMRTVGGCFRLAGVKARVEGLENIPAGASVLAANHLSNLDPLLLLPPIPRRVSVLVKQELFKIPIFSTGMRQAGYVPINRADREAAAESLQRAAAVLRSGLPILVFAEGTRSPDGHMRPFKRGAFVMAIDAGVPIVPVSISGTQDLLRKGDWVLRPGEVVIRFGEPVDASAYSPERRAELMARVEALVAAGLPESQQPLISRAQVTPVTPASP
jgi:1-acyl-sn-glycerol-3-phosphate acyltransferase